MRGRRVPLLAAALATAVAASTEAASYFPMPSQCSGWPHSHVRGAAISANGLAVSFCNTTAWTFRDLNASWGPVLTPTGFAQVVSNVRVAPNESAKHWLPLHKVACPVVPRGPNGPPAPGAPYGSGFLGTGHGGEYVFGVQVVATLPQGAPPERVDLLAGSALPPARSWPQGTTLAVEKQSQIGPFEVEERVELLAGGRFVVSANITPAFDDVNATVNFLYPAMSMFAEPFVEWVATLLNGTTASGKFAHDDSFTLRADIEWAAVFDGKGAGAVYQYPGGVAYHGKKGFWNSFWNRAYDHKLYLQVDPPLAVGQRVEYTHVVVPFQSSPSNWTTVAASLVEGWKGARSKGSDDQSAIRRSDGGSAGAVGMQTAAATPALLDLADPSAAAVWIGHPAVGEASFDCFTHDAKPILVGSPPFGWPVNGFLYPETPDGRNLTVYVGMYGAGYRGPNTSSMLAMSSSDGGATFSPGVYVCNTNDNKTTIFNRTRVHCPDGSALPDGEGGVHVVFDWSTGLGAPGADPDNGLAYMRCSTPLGPCSVAPTPVNSMKSNGALPAPYRTTYGGTLLRRDNDWLVLTAVSTRGNAGGVWALAALTASQPQGPWSAPEILLHPGSSRWHPHPCEFYPCFASDGFAYCTCTSLQANRGYQVMFRAPLADATTPDAWEVHQAGSLYHWDGTEGRAMGIWGQTLTGFVESSGAFRVMYPSRNSRGDGSINLASCPSFVNLTTRGFWVSAPNADSVAVYPRTFAGVNVNATVTLAAPGHGWTLRWNWRGAMGPKGAGAAGLAPTPAALSNCTALCFDGRGHASLVQLGAPGTVPVFLAQGVAVATAQTLSVSVEQAADGAVWVAVNGESVLSSRLPAPGSDVGGSLAVHATQGATLHVTAFAVTAASGPLPPQQWLRLTAADGVSGAGSASIRGWAKVSGPEFRDGEGMASSGGGSAPAMAKFNFVGTACRLWLPRGPAWGAVSVAVDGGAPEVVSLHAAAATPSAVVFEWEEPHAGAGAAGSGGGHRHALVVGRVNGTVVVDTAEYMPFLP